MAWLRVNQNNKTVWVNGARVCYVTEADGAGGPRTNIYFEKDLSILVDGSLEKISGLLRELAGVER
jgi:hypothetical protein